MYHVLLGFEKINPTWDFRLHCSKTMCNIKDVYMQGYFSLEKILPVFKIL